VTHASVLAAIAATGGRLVASFTLDEDGRTVGARKTHNAGIHCSKCDDPGHSAPRCRGAGEPPKLTHQERRRIGKDWLADAARAAGDPLAESKAILAARAEHRRQARKR
jgi:hypothetical protein